MSETVAAIDCGSNSTRVLIADRNGATIRRDMRITRLGDGVDATHRLMPEAMERTFVTLRAYRDFMDEAGVSAGRLVATSAVRDADNGEEFLREAASITGVTATILSGNDEARFSYEGAVEGLVTPEGFTPLVLDIGGGSSEIALKLDDTVVGASMQLGCVRVTERALGRGPVSPESEAAARSMIESEMQRVFAMEPSLAAPSSPVQFVGLAGTVATLVQLVHGVADYDRAAVHHQIVQVRDVSSWRERLSQETPEQRLSHVGMTPGRQDVLVSGLLILEEVMRHYGVGELISSENDILDGLVGSIRRDLAARA